MQKAAADTESAYESREAPESEEEVLRRCDRLIAYFARKFRVETDDLTQIGRIALIEAHRAWQTKPHFAAFWTYARKAVLGEMLNHMTREAARAVKEAECGLAPAPFCSPDDAYEAREHVSALGEREASVLEAYVAGHPVPEIAEQHGISRARAYQLLEGAAENIRRRA